MRLLMLIVLMVSTSVNAAGLPVFDIASFRNTLASSVNSATQLKNQVEEIKWAVESVKRQTKSLQKLEVNSLGELNDLLNGNSFKVNSFLSSLNGIGYSINTVTNQYNRLFPMDKIDKEVDMSVYQDYYRSWNTELSNAARESMQAQTVLKDISQHNVAAARILARSKNSQGQMGMLESIMESLTLISNQMSNLTQVLATSGRTMAVAAASDAASESAADTASNKLWSGYSDMGKPAKKLNKMPKPY